MLGVTNADNETPMHVAIKHGNEQFALELIKENKNWKRPCSAVDIESYRDQMTPYFMAVLKGMTVVADSLVEVGFVDPTRRNAAGYTIKELAVTLRSSKACNYLGIPITFVPKDLA